MVKRFRKERLDNVIRLETGIGCIHRKKSNGVTRISVITEPKKNNYFKLFSKFMRF